MKNQMIRCNERTTSSLKREVYHSSRAHARVTQILVKTLEMIYHREYYRYNDQIVCSQCFLLVDEIFINSNIDVCHSNCRFVERKSSGELSIVK